MCIYIERTANREMQVRCWEFHYQLVRAIIYGARTVVFRYVGGGDHDKMLVAFALICYHTELSPIRKMENE